MSRKFEVIKSYKDKDIRMPWRKTRYSAGYDFEAAEAVSIPPKKIMLVPTGVKAHMEYDEVLTLHIRSSLAVKKGLLLANGTGIIDADYVDNPDNEGHIQLALWNTTKKIITIKKGEAVAQGIFYKYLLTNDDEPGEGRLGGFGSTDKDEDF